MSKLAGKTALVTGASKGIGASIAKHLAAEGANVIVNYGRSKPEADAVVAAIAAAGGKAIAVQGDISNQDQVKGVFRAAREQFGRVDILINNAGVYGATPLGTIDASTVSRYFDLNVAGLLYASQEAAAQFGDVQGVIINISSTVAVTPAPGMSVYSATKAAVDNITRALALELGPKARVVSLAPGFTITEGSREMEGAEQFEPFAISRTPLGRVGQPQDIAKVAAFLASADADWISGEVIQAGGGIRM